MSEPNYQTYLDVTQQQDSAEDWLLTLGAWMEMEKGDWN